MMSTEASLLSNEVQIEMLRQAIEQSSSGFFCCDCMDGMKAIPDKYFDLAIVDPPYGIGATRFNNGAGLKDHAQGSTALKARQNRFHGAGKLHDRVLNRSNLDWDNEPPKHEYFEELFRVSRNQIIWGGTTSIYRQHAELSCGINNNRGRISLRLSMLGLLLMRRRRCSHIGQPTRRTSSIRLRSHLIYTGS